MFQDSRARTESDAAIATYLARYPQGSRKTKAVALRRFADWHAGAILDATRAEIEMFSHHLQDTVGLKRSTVYSYLATLSGFYKLAVGDGRIAQDPTVMVRRPRVQYDDDRLTRLSTHDVERMLLTAQGRSPQHTAIVALLGLLALRASEAASVRIENMKDHERGHRVLRLVGKGGKPATIPLPPLVARILDRAAAGRTDGPLLLSRTGRQLDRNDIYKRVATIGRDAGLGHVHPHQLRHAGVTAALDAGRPRTRRASLRAVVRWAHGRAVRPEPAINRPARVLRPRRAPVRRRRPHRRVRCGGPRRRRWVAGGGLAAAGAGRRYPRSTVRRYGAEPASRAQALRGVYGDGGVQGRPNPVVPCAGASRRARPSAAHTAAPGISTMIAATRTAVCSSS